MWYIMHYGLGHDDNPPGRGSGRYPFGSGKRPYQGIKQDRDKILMEKYKITKDELDREKAIQKSNREPGLLEEFYDKNEDKIFSFYNKYFSFDKENIKLLNRYKEVMKETENRWKTEKVDKETGFHLKNREFTEEEDMKYINPGFVNFSENTKNNCVLCSVTYELRRRGYDVVANRVSNGYDEYISYPEWFINPIINTIPIKYDVKKRGLFFKEYVYDNEGFKNKVINELSNQGVGARGNLFLSWDKKGLSGHAIAYDVTDKGLFIRDCQDNTIYTPDNLHEILNDSYDITYVRLDNLKINKKNIKECAR